MPTSFGAMHEETRPLRLLESEVKARTPHPLGATLAAALLIVLPALAAALL